MTTYMVATSLHHLHVRRQNHTVKWCCAVVVDVNQKDQMMCTLDLNKRRVKRRVKQ